MNEKITGILFDIGGVLVKMNGVPAMAKLLDKLPDHEAQHNLWLTSASVVKHETGKINAHEFAAGVVGDLILPISAAKFLAIFREWPQGLLPGALKLLKEIPNEYQLAALSNTSAIHWEKIQALGIEILFKQLYLSHEIGHLKPAVEAYEIAIKGMGLNAKEILFFDDNQRNIESAKKLGMVAHHVSSPAEARRVLESYQILSPRRLA